MFKTDSLGKKELHVEAEFTSPAGRAEYDEKEDNESASNAGETECTLNVNSSINKNNDRLCRTCGKEFPDKWGLRSHTKAVHLKNTDYKCGKCGAGFPFKSYLARHKMKIHEKITWPCKECGKAFSEETSLSAHMKGVHLKIKDQICNECGAAFSYKNKLTRHKKEVHLKIKCRKK